MRRLHWVNQLIDRRQQQPDLCRHQACPGNLSACMLVVLLLLTGPALAQTEWTGASSDSWFSAANWIPQAVPTEDSVDIDVTQPNTTRVADQATGDLNLISIGVVNEGLLTITDGGVVNAVDGFIAITEGSGGEVVVEGPLAHWNVSSRIRVGSQGSGKLSITDGAQVTSNVGTVGLAASAQGVTDISGAGSKWTSTTQLVVGWSGIGVLTLQDGAALQTNNGWVGSSEGQGSVSVTNIGSTWISDGYLIIGETLGSGQFEASHGAEISSNRARIGFSSGTGEFTLSGSGTSWSNNDTLAIGMNGGNGTLSIGNGTEVTVGSTVTVGENSTSSGLLIVDGQLDTGGGLIILENGVVTGNGTVNGTVEINGGGALSPAGSQGTLSTGSLQLGEGGAIQFRLGGEGLERGVVQPLLSVDGDVVLAGTLDIIDLGGLDSGEYVLMAFSGTLNDSGLEIGEVPPGFIVALDTSTTGQLGLSVTADEIWHDRFEQD